MLPAHIESALVDIGAQLDDHQLDYCIGGSVMLALNGLDTRLVTSMFASPGRIEPRSTRSFPSTSIARRQSCGARSGRFGRSGSPGKTRSAST